MSHNIMHRENRDAMFVVGDREAAWHRLGQRTPNAVNWQEAMKLADLDWQVIKKPSFARNPAGKVTELPVFALFRSDDSAYLGIVKGRYNIIQNRDAFTFVDGLLEAKNGAHYDSAGALGNGERIWCAAKVPFDFSVDKGDRHETYLLFTTAHDGSEAAECKLTTVRVVCQNTLSSALSEAGNILRFRHTKSAQDRMARAVELMSGVGGSVKALETKLVRLAETKLNRESTEAILDKLFPKVKGQNEKKRDERVRAVLELFAKNDNNAFPGIKGTAYNMLNAVTEYADHFRTVRAGGHQDRQEVRAGSAMFGSGNALKQTAMAELLTVAGGGINLDHVVEATRANSHVN